MSAIASAEVSAEAAASGDPVDDEQLAHESVMPPIPRHPLLGVTVAVLVVLSFVTFGFEPRAFIAAFATGALAVLAAIDIEHRLLPNRILFPTLAVVVVAQIGFYPEQAA